MTKQTYLPSLNHLPHSPHDERPERQMPRRQHRPISIPTTNIARLKRSMRLQPPRRHRAGDTARHGNRRDQPRAGPNVLKLQG